MFFHIKIKKVVNKGNEGNGRQAKACNLNNQYFFKLIHKISKKTNLQVS